MKIEKYKTKKGEIRHKFKIRLGDKVTTRAGFITKTDAIREYNNLMESQKNKLQHKIKYSDLYDQWDKIYITLVKESTYQRTSMLFINHILPVFGEIYVDKITPLQCQNFAMNLVDYTKGKEMFNQAKRVIDYGVKMRYLKENPFNDVILPKFKSKSVKVDCLDRQEILKLLDFYKDDLKWYLVFRLLIYTGLRRGELLALEWEDVNFKANSISVNKSLSIGTNYKVYVSTTKTKKSARKVLVDDITMAYLRKLKKLNADNSIIVFTTKDGKHQRLSNISDKLNTAIKKLGIKKVRVHDLRHTHASLLFASGSNAKEIQERLGHSDIKTTLNIYTHLYKDGESRALNNFMDYMSNEKM
ncbi:MAG: site-specific integrase [Tissierellia bacterium]|nr:site-specific integrase [Tissierellia bacterium]